MVHEVDELNLYNTYKSFDFSPLPHDKRVVCEELLSYDYKNIETIQTINFVIHGILIDCWLYDFR